MKKQPVCNVGVAGAAARRSHFAKLLAQTGFFHCQGACDTNEEGLLKIQKDSGAPEAFLEYEDMLGRADIQAVFIGTPMQHHAGMAIAALNRGLHVLCEVTAAIGVDECRELVEAAERSSATYMLAEHYTFRRPNRIIKDLVAAGLFGVPYYAEGEYIHELKGLMDILAAGSRESTASPTAPIPSARSSNGCPATASCPFPVSAADTIGWIRAETITKTKTPASCSRRPPAARSSKSASICSATVPTR